MKTNEIISGGRALACPPDLERGSRVAIVSPASKIDPALIDGATSALESEGFECVVMPYAKGANGSFSGLASERLSDLENALADGSVGAIVCSRGGYGAVHLLEQLDRLPEECFNKWLVGFSDITALHCLWTRKGYASLHGAMAKYIGRGSEFPYYETEMEVLRGGNLKIMADAHPFNQCGCAEGVVTGGNLAVLGGLIGTPFDPFESVYTAEAVESGAVARPMLFIEDIAEPIYKVERILWQLHLRGVFRRVSAVLVGQFTEYRPSADHPDMYTMMHRFFGSIGIPDIPIVYDLPVGHVEANAPLLLGCPTIVEATSSGVTITQRQSH